MLRNEPLAYFSRYLSGVNFRKGPPLASFPGRRRLLIAVIELLAVCVAAWKLPRVVCMYMVHREVHPGPLCTVITSIVLWTVRPLRSCVLMQFGAWGGMSKFSVRFELWMGFCECFVNVMDCWLIYIILFSEHNFFIVTEN